MDDAVVANLLTSIRIRMAAHVALALSQSPFKHWYVPIALNCNEMLVNTTNPQNVTAMGNIFTMGISTC
jgi:hypothetical protein